VEALADEASVVVGQRDDVTGRRVAIDLSDRVRVHPRMAVPERASPSLAQPHARLACRLVCRRRHSVSFRNFRVSIPYRWTQRQITAYCRFIRRATSAPLPLDCASTAVSPSRGGGGGRWRPAGAAARVRPAAAPASSGGG